MEVMEDGNLMDKVHILIQRDLEYYKCNQAVLQENICSGVVGGRLDFPRSASFAAIKLVHWWEEEYLAAFKVHSGFLPRNTTTKVGTKNDEESSEDIVKDSDPAKFVSLISKSGEDLLEHLHVLTQEALDHADLSVLTGTIGATCLLKNCLWSYVQLINELKTIKSEPLQRTLKQYQEMGEALAERLLDLHCRLVSLYILQEPESMDWHNERVFCESERGSYVIQMWWVYMKGTRDDLWSTVPPKMAQRVFAGLLNESLTILTVRYTQARTKLLTVDINNLLLCVGQLIPSIASNGEEFIGIALHNKNKILRDIHTKCQELFHCLILRAVPLNILDKVLSKGVENLEMLKSKVPGPAPWVTFALPHIFQAIPKMASPINKMAELPENVAIALEMIVLLEQPQANWALLIKVLGMRKCKVLQLILEESMRNFVADNMQRPIHEPPKSCKNFLCFIDGTCSVSSTNPPKNSNHNVTNIMMNQIDFYELIHSSTRIFLKFTTAELLQNILFPLITKFAPNSWTNCFDRRLIWNETHSPPWYESVMDMARGIMPIVCRVALDACQTGASIYQAMSVVIASFSHFWEGVDAILALVARQIDTLLPAEVAPIADSALLQILIGALYGELQKQALIFAETGDVEGEGYAMMLAESICAIDEDNLHTDQIEDFLQQINEDFDQEENDWLRNLCENGGFEGVERCAEVVVSDLLINVDGKLSLNNVYDYIKCNKEWFLHELQVSNCDFAGDFGANSLLPKSETLLQTIFYIGDKKFDQLLTEEWRPDWLNLLQTQMGLSVERVWSQLTLRWDFRDKNMASLTVRDSQIVTNITSLLKQ